MEKVSRIQWLARVFIVMLLVAGYVEADYQNGNNGVIGVVRYLLAAGT